MKNIIFLVLSAALLFASCGKDSSTGSPAGEEVEVNMTLSTNTPGTRAAIEAENTINTVDLLIFDAGSAATADDATYEYTRYAWKTSTGKYRATLKTGSGLNIYFAVNARTLLESVDMTGKTFAQVRELLVMNDPSAVTVSGGLPMWGYKLGCTITETTSSNSLGTIELLRSIASTDVSVSTSANFTLAKGHIVYGVNKGYLAYTGSRSADDNGNLQLDAPETPPSYSYMDWSSMAITTTSETVSIDNVFYMFDNSGDGTGGTHYTKLVLEGKWSGTDKTDNTFYPLAFRNSDNERLKVTRNRKYILLVTNVNGDGYDTLDEAKEGEDANMDYEVIEWNQNSDSDIIIDGSKYISINKEDEVIVGRLSGSTVERVFTTNYDTSNIEMRFSTSDSWNTTGSISSSRFQVDVVNSTYTCFKVTALQDYGTDDNPATLYVRIGSRVSFTLTIRQVQTDWNDGGEIGIDLEFNS